MPIYKSIILFFIFFYLTKVLQMSKNSTWVLKYPRVLGQYPDINLSRQATFCAQIMFRNILFGPTDQ